MAGYLAPKLSGGVPYLAPLEPSAGGDTLTIGIIDGGDVVACTILAGTPPAAVNIGIVDGGDVVACSVLNSAPTNRSMEEILFDTLKGLVANRVFPSIAPELTPTPYITYQSAGGEQAINFMDGEQPSKKNARIQINVWDKSLINALKVAQRAETAMRGASATLSTTVASGQRTTYEQDTKLHGTIQFFSCWADISS